MVMHDSCNSSSGNRDGGVTVVVMTHLYHDTLHYEKNDWIVLFKQF